jgi:hypothetical protein
MENYTYSESRTFEDMLIAGAWDNQSAIELVIERECDVRICCNWEEVIHSYPQTELADVLLESANSGIISSNSRYFILCNDGFECAEHLTDVYSIDDINQAIRNTWGEGNSELFADLNIIDTVTGTNWQLFYVDMDNRPTSLDRKILDKLVANGEEDLLVELANEKCWALYWN